MTSYKAFERDALMNFKVLWVFLICQTMAKGSENQPLIFGRQINQAEMKQLPKRSLFC